MHGKQEGYELDEASGPDEERGNGDRGAREKAKMPAKREQQRGERRHEPQHDDGDGKNSWPTVLAKKYTPKKRNRCIK